MKQKRMTNIEYELIRITSEKGEFEIYNVITGKKLDTITLLKDWRKNGKLFKAKQLLEHPMTAFTDLKLIPKEIEPKRKVRK